MERNLWHFIGGCERRALVWFGLVHRFFVVVNCERKVNQWERAKEAQSMVSFSETRPYTVACSPKKWPGSQAQTDIIVKKVVK